VWGAHQLPWEAQRHGDIPGVWRQNTFLVGERKGGSHASPMGRRYESMARDFFASSKHFIIKKGTLCV
jgi:hypothetical protein